MWKLRTLFVLAAVITLLLSRFVFNSTVRLFPKIRIIQQNGLLVNEIQSTLNSPIHHYEYF